MFFKGLQFNDDYYLMFIYIFERLGINRIKIMDSLSNFIYELIIEGDDEVKAPQPVKGWGFLYQTDANRNISYGKYVTWHL